ncbi:MAG: bacterial transcriptional activator domain-containing protein [Acidobacteriia bacterium]|nr:bacterial transcriptional activator domain-containing protein [Terriglobia bacterium]
MTIRLFGQFSVCCGEKALEDLIPGKAKELLCYLLTHRERPIVRESLATILWDDCTTEHSRQYLRKALWQLQRILCRTAKSEGSILKIDSQWVSVNPDVEMWLDVKEFERAVYAPLGSPWSIDASHLEAVETAVNLYRGDLLEGWYQDWCLCERERLQNIYLVMLGRLVAHFEACRECHKGINYAMQMLRFDRAHEIAHQHLMRLRYMSGDRAGALRQYEHCAAALKEELNVQPSERTRALFRQIREDSVSMASESATDVHEPKAEAALLQGALNRLQELTAALANLQSAVEETSANVGKALRSSTVNPTTSDRTRQ